VLWLECRRDASGDTSQWRHFLTIVRDAAHLARLATEQADSDFSDLDRLPLPQLVTLMAEQARRAGEAVADAAGLIAPLVEAVVFRLGVGGRLIYVGAGTSGRLGVVDASEMPPTFSVPRGVVIGLIAGGESAMFRSIEGAEDNQESGREDIARLQVNALDSVMGIAASGRTPYVIGALVEARTRGALTISLACTNPAPIHANADINIAPLTGPEVIEGSTRMKAGTATKLVLNMLSTAVMIKLGKTYGNLMVDLQPTNQKLRERARRIVERATGLSSPDAQALLNRSGGVKTAIVAHLAQVSPEEARSRLHVARGSVRRVLNSK